MTTTTHTSQAFAMPALVPAHDCRICAKAPAQPHTSATRATHADYAMRMGFSAMCPAPRQN